MLYTGNFMKGNNINTTAVNLKQIPEQRCVLEQIKKNSWNFHKKNLKIKLKHASTIFN